MIFIDPSELRKTSNLLRYISDMVYKPLPDLEAITGADVMICPDGLPLPSTENMIRYHIDIGAKLIQLKFGHDLPQSIVDNRLNEALSRMLRVGAMSWQCLLLFIGMLSRDDTKGMATVNGQLTYSVQPMKWKQIQAALNFWTERGGSIDFPLSSGKLLPEHLEIHQEHINRFFSGEDIKTLWPNAPVFYDEIEPKNPHLKQWKVAQKLIVIDDLRPLLCAIPGCRIGPAKATAIFEYMAENNIRQDFAGFTDMLKGSKPELLKVPGIGKKIVNDIQWGLWHTLEEREKRNDKSN